MQRQQRHHPCCACVAQALTAEERLPYEQKGQADRERYEAQNRAYVERRAEREAAARAAREAAASAQRSAEGARSGAAAAAAAAAATPTWGRAAPLPRANHELVRLAEEAFWCHVQERLDSAETPALQAQTPAAPAATWRAPPAPGLDTPAVPAPATHPCLPAAWSLARPRRDTSPLLAPSAGPTVWPHEPQSEWSNATAQQPCSTAAAAAAAEWASVRGRRPAATFAVLLPGNACRVLPLRRAWAEH